MTFHTERSIKKSEPLLEHVRIMYAVDRVYTKDNSVWHVRLLYCFRCYQIVIDNICWLFSGFLARDQRIFYTRAYAGTWMSGLCYANARWNGNNLDLEAVKIDRFSASLVDESRRMSIACSIAWYSSVCLCMEVKWAVMYGGWRGRLCRLRKEAKDWPLR